MERNSNPTVKKLWIKPEITERSSLAEAKVIKTRGLVEAVILGVAVGPHS